MLNNLVIMLYFYWTEEYHQHVKFNSGTDQYLFLINWASPCFWQFTSTLLAIYPPLAECAQWKIPFSELFTPSRRPVFPPISLSWILSQVPFLLFGCLFESLNWWNCKTFVQRKEWLLRRLGGGWQWRAGPIPSHKTQPNTNSANIMISIRIHDVLFCI